MLFVCHPKILHKRCLQFLLVVKMAPRETENSAYAKVWGDKQRALLHDMVFSGVVNCADFHPLVADKSRFDLIIIIIIIIIIILRFRNRASSSVIEVDSNSSSKKTDQQTTKARYSCFQDT